jgi:hypothetical protein
MEWGNKFKADKTGKFGQYFLIGRVKSIVLGPYVRSLKVSQSPDGVTNSTNTLSPDPDFTSWKDIGKIRFEILYSNLSESKLNNITEPAYPMFSFVKQFPVLGEIVLIMSGPSTDLNDNFNAKALFYFPPYAMWNGVNHNAFPNLEEYSKYTEGYSSQPGFEGKTQSLNLRVPLGKTFIEFDNIKNLRPFEGDVILESRYGQSIRFGSTVKGMRSLNHWSDVGNTGDPITIIRNGQGTTDSADKFSTTVEDINTDKSSIYLTAGQKIVLEDIINFPFASYGKGIGVQNQNILQIELAPTTNEEINASTQDSKNLA